jgi:regulator of RNase E activity RraA
VANAIEAFKVRLRNEGFTDGRLRSLVSRGQPMVGHAVTMRMKSSNPPAEGRFYADRTDWLNYIQSLPTPRVIVIEDVDEHPCASSFAGGTHANVWKALGCVGIVTNGALRDLPLLEETGLHVYAGALVPSHGFAHLVDFGHRVTIAGLEISSGDLLHGDVHGIVTVPPEVVDRIPAECAAMLQREQRLAELCRSKDFSIEKLREALQQS